MANEPSRTDNPGGGAGYIDSLLARGMLALDNERSQEAEQIAAEMLSADPHNAHALYILGCALTMQDRALEAIAPLKAAALGRDDPKVDTLLAIALRQTGRHEEAVSLLEVATRRQPPYATAFLEFGYLLALMDRHDEAADVLSRGLKIAPMVPQLSTQLGYAHLSRRDCANAKVAFAHTLDISPGSHDALFGMAKAHQELGENEEAVAYFRSYLTDRSNDGGARLNLGHCLLELGQTDAGYECFRRAAQGDAQRYGNALISLASAARGRFWLRPSAAARFLLSSQS